MSADAGDREVEDDAERYKTSPQGKYVGILNNQPNSKRNYYLIKS